MWCMYYYYLYLYVLHGRITVFYEAIFWKGILLDVLEGFWWNLHQTRPYWEILEGFFRRVLLAWSTPLQTFHPQNSRLTLIVEKYGFCTRICRHAYTTFLLLNFDHYLSFVILFFYYYLSLLVWKMARC